MEIADFINIQVKDKPIYGPAVDIYATAPRDAEEAESQHTEEPPEDDNPQSTEPAQEAGEDSNPTADYMVVIRRPRPTQNTDSFHTYVGDREEEEEAAAQARRRWFGWARTVNQRGRRVLLQLVPTGGGMGAIYL